MDAVITLQDNFHFKAVADSGFVVDLDTRAPEGEMGRGATPMEMVMISLAGCTAMDVVSILRKKRQNMTEFEIRIHGDRATDHPKVFTDFEMEYVVRGVDIDPAAVERAIQLSMDTYCSVHAMLEKAAAIRTRFTIIEE
ncbi:MAG: osmotically inducible protein OsmC [Anaerolineae bacterium]|nr:MAG: osmotically inducible protein OsmC [Anaerolineae bacterium]